MESTIKHALMFTAMVLISILVLFETCSAEAYIEAPAGYYPLPQSRGTSSKKMQGLLWLKMQPEIFGHLKMKTSSILTISFL